MRRENVLETTPKTTDGAADAPSTVQVYLLGGFRVVVGGRVMGDDAWRRRKARQLFKCLLSRPQRRLLKDEAIDLFWPDSDPEAASTNFRTTLHAIRQALEGAGGGQLVTADRDTICLRSGPDIWVDSEAFEELIASARTADDPIPRLEQASALYRGDYLPDDVYEDWATERRDALRRAWTDLEFRLAQHYEQHGAPEAALTELRRLLQTDTSNERAGQDVMRLLLELGRRPEALRVFQGLEQVLRDELGVEPSERTLELQRQAARRAPPAPTLLAPAFRCAYPFPQPGQLIGRDAELARLRRILERASTLGQAVLISAPAGTGKSTLAGRLVEMAQETGALCLAGGSYDEPGVVPLAPFQEALTDYMLAASGEHDLSSVASELMEAMGELRPHLGIGGRAPDDRSTSRMRLFGSVLGFIRSLAEHKPVLLCLEDLHAVDAATLHLFQYLVRQTRRVPVVLVGTFRDEVLRPGEPLTQFVTLLARDRLVEHLRLTSLGQHDTRRLVINLLGQPVSEDLNTSLFTASEGNPLFVEQLVLALREEGRLDQPSEVWQPDAVGSHVPVVIREVINQRLARLSGRGRDTLEHAAVLGHVFDHGTLLALLEPFEESTLLSDLDEAIRAQVLRETGAGYAFGHSLLRDGLYWGLSGPRRMLLHARAGETLEHLAGPNAANRAAELAYHFGLAGLGAPVRARALQYSLQAGRHAAGLSSFRQALVHFSKACELIARESDAIDVATRLEALEGRGHAERELAAWRESIATSRQILDLSDTPARRAAARGHIAYALLHTGDIAGVQNETVAGLAELMGADGPQVVAARLYFQQVTALVWYLEGRYRDVVDLGQRMQLETAHLDDPSLAARAHLVAGWGHMGQGHVAEALEQHELAVSAAERAGDKIQLAIAYENLGLQSFLGGRFSAAKEQLQRALAIFRESASELRAVNALQHLCRVWVAEGELDRAHSQASLAVELEVAGEERWVADGQQVLASIHSLRAEWDTARAYVGQALAIRRRVGDTGGTVESLVALGRIDQNRGDWPGAMQLYAEAVALAEQIHAGIPLVMARRHLGRLALLIHERTTAAQSIQTALDLAEQMPESLEHAPTLLAMAEWYLEEDDAAQALAFAERALLHAKPIECIIEAEIMTARAYFALNRPMQASTHAIEATARAERLGAPHLVALAHSVSTRVHAAD